MPQIPVNPVRQGQLIAFAREAIARGEYELGERIAREMNSVGWGDARTWLIIAEVACTVGRKDVAQQALAAVAAQGAVGPEAERIRQRLESIVPASPPPERFHVIRAWGQGFWSDMSHVVGQLIVADLTGRTPVVLWGKNSRFGAGDENRWLHFFEPVSDAPPPRRGDFFPAKWNAENLLVADNNPLTGPGSRIAFLPFLSSTATTTVSEFHAPVMAISHWIPASHPLGALPLRDVYGAILAARVRPRAEILSRVDEMANGLGIGAPGSPVVAVHVRGSDKIVEVGDLRATHEAYHLEIARQIETLGKDARVLLLTDWEPAAADYRTRYGPRLIETAALRTSGNVGLHFLEDRDGRRLGEDVLIDTLLAARCDALVGLAYSNVSLFMSYFARARGLSNERIALAGPNQHHNYNWFLLRRN